jgi:hypothetical protein
MNQLVHTINFRPVSGTLIHVRLTRLSGAKGTPGGYHLMLADLGTDYSGVGILTARPTIRTSLAVRYRITSVVVMDATPTHLIYRTEKPLRSYPQRRQVPHLTAERGNPVSNILQLDTAVLTANQTPIMILKLV